MMRQRTQSRARDRRRVRQLDLFGVPAPMSGNWPAPTWQGLPEETRRVLTGLMSRLLLDHGRAKHRLLRVEAVDDV
jgi:hypothetical protein